MITGSQYGRHKDAELPQELIFAIQRILELNAENQTDPLDVLSNDFNPIDMLNQLFPDGAFTHWACKLCQLNKVQRPR